MFKLLSEWSPSVATIDVIKLNDITDEHITKKVEYLQNDSELNHIDDIAGYDDWN